MHIKKISICNFRTLKKFDLLLDEKSNLIFGDNGVGKTSILEAIYMLGFGKTFKEKRHKNLLKYGEDTFSIYASIHCLLGNYSINANFNNNIFSLMIDEKKSLIKDVQKYFFPLFFSSEYSQIILSSQNERRKFFNRLIFGLDSLYLSNLLSYNHSIYQKNHLLKQNSHNIEISSWNQVIYEMAYSLTNYRYKFIERLNTGLANIFGLKAYVKYDASIPIEKYPSSHDFLTFLNGNIQIDKKNKYSFFGPHRDRFYFNSMLDIDILSSSSGERKIYFLYIFLIYCEIFFSFRGEYPLFLIDDFDTALDDKNKETFQKINNRIQIISTAVKKDLTFNYSFCLK